MKQRTSPVGQYILEGLGEIENAHDYIEQLVPLIGEVVLYFNSLESSLDSCLCAFISDRSDQKGLLVLHKMNYKTKVDLYERFTREYLRTMDWDIKAHENLITSLNECGSLRNKVVHANWEYTDEEGFTQVRIKYTKQGLEHELWQFSIESMNEILKKIEAAITALSDFEEECEERMCQWNQDIASRLQGKEADPDE